MSRCGAIVSIALVAIVVALAVDEAAAFELTACEGMNTTYTKLEVSACPGFKGKYCDLSPHQKVTLKLDFETPEDFKVLRTHMEVYGYSDRKWACDLGAKCPSKVGDAQHLVWTTDLPIKPNEPVMTELTIGAIDPNTKQFLICYKMPARLSNVALPLRLSSIA